MSDEFLKDDEPIPDSESQAPGWLEAPNPPTHLPKDPKAKVLAVTTYLESCPGLSLADLARIHPKWFYDKIFKHLIPKESKVEVSGEVLTDIQIDARIQHILTVLGPESIAKYLPDAIDCTPEPAELPDFME